MVHVDAKNLRRIPNGGGHRIHGCVQGEARARAPNLAEGRRTDRGQVRSYFFIHHAAVDYSRSVYSETVPDETQATMPAFMRYAIAPFHARGVRFRRVMTDNGSCYCPVP